MKFCPNCGAQLEGQAVFCPNCGAGFDPNMQQNPAAYTSFLQYYDPYDHTSEFDVNDISANKIFAMLPYLMSIPGIIIALLGASGSPYVGFHVRQALKFKIIEVLVGIVTALLVWTVIVPFAAAVFMLILVVLQIMMFFSICKGQAKEPAIIRSISFLK